MCGCVRCTYCYLTVYYNSVQHLHKLPLRLQPPQINASPQHSVTSVVNKGCFVLYCTAPYMWVWCEAKGQFLVRHKIPLNSPCEARHKPWLSPYNSRLCFLEILSFSFPNKLVSTTCTHGMHACNGSRSCTTLVYCGWVFPRLSFEFAMNHCCSSWQGFLFLVLL